MKRFQETYPDNDASKPRRRLRLPATPASKSPFPILKVTKSGTARTEQQVSAGQGQKGSSQHMFPPTTMDQLTPYPTTQQQQKKHPNQPALDPTNERAGTDRRKGTQHSEVPSVVVNNPETVTVIQGLDHTTPTLDDEYPLDDLEEEAMSLLRVAPNCVHEGHIPPSSVTRAWDHDSRSAEDYDLNLQYSSPLPSEGYRTGLHKQLPATENDASLLDEDVDWEAVFAATQDTQTQVHGNKETISPSDGLISLSPFVRPPFAEKVRDRCSVPGLSSRTVLRTCFRIGMMLNQTIRCFNHRQDVVFELFARVNYSSRENLSRKQHFQFVDLFKDQQPFPSGVLAGWKIGSEMDRHGAAFLNTHAGPKLCWCLCRPVKDRKAAIGWTYMVLSIKETNWDQIRWSKRIVCGEIEEQTGRQSEDVAAVEL